MNLPIPNSEETTRFMELYQKEFGVELSRNQAFEIFSQLVAFIYLTEYHSIRPLRSQEPISRKLKGAGNLKRRKKLPPENLLRWYDKLSHDEKDQCW